MNPLDHLEKIGVVAHPTMPRAAEAAERLQKIADSRALKLVADPWDEQPDLILALGGDGTILRAARVAHAKNVPLAGANLGKLGFLSTGDAGHLDRMIDELMDGKYGIEKRMMLEARAIHHGGEVKPTTALNEVVIERGTLSRVVAINVSVGGDPVATYVADGFIVSTPTGSTAYSLSAGGPVVEPEVQAMVLTSVSAHSPLWRSIVVGPDRTVTLDTPADAVAFSADGQPVEILEAASRVTVTPHPEPLQLLSPGSTKFYEKLRSRFHVEPGFQVPWPPRGPQIP